ncbi:MAG TPA: hypothetical protein VEA37_08155 [Flavobacterium sp.]|nr:hypothetical protein [Flavobacterium sp.]
MKSARSFWNYIKPLVRSTVDSCILPGIITGSEICWLYIMEWKKETYTISIAMLALLLYQFDVPADSQIYSSQSVVESESCGMNQNS